jgi:hypothetical protein
VLLKLLIAVVCLGLISAGCGDDQSDDALPTEPIRIEAPSDVRGFIALAQDEATAESAECGRFERARKDRSRDEWCLVEFDSGPRVYVEKGWRWLEQPAGDGMAPTRSLPLRLPPEFVSREPVKDCGRLSVKLEMLASVRLADPALDCFQRALRGGESAELQARSISEEGKTVNYIRTMEGGAVEIFTDATKGGLGPSGWYYRVCRKVELDLRERGCEGSRLLAP